MKADIKVSYRTYYWRNGFTSQTLKEARKYARMFRSWGCRRARITRIVATTTYREEAVK